MKRAQFKFSDGTADVLDKLAGEMDSPRVDIVRMGIRLVARARAESQKGNRIGVVNNGRVVTEIDGEWSGIPA